MNMSRVRAEAELAIYLSQILTFKVHTYEGTDKKKRYAVRGQGPGQHDFIVTSDHELAEGIARELNDRLTPARDTAQAGAAEAIKRALA